MAKDEHAPGAKIGAAELMLIAGIDRVTAERLILLGLSSFAEIAAWNCADVQRWRARLGLDDRISRGCWIEQAALLARGIQTSYATRVRRGEVAALVRRPMVEPPPIPLEHRRPPPMSADKTSERPPANGSGGSLMRRLGRAAHTQPVQPLRPNAAGPVEEATVEIVRRGPAEKKSR